MLKYDWDTKPDNSSLTRKANQLLASLTPSLLLKQNHFAKLCFQTCERGMAMPTLEDGAHPLPYAKTSYWFLNIGQKLIGVLAIDWNSIKEKEKKNGMPKIVLSLTLLLKTGFKS